MRSLAQPRRLVLIVCGTVFVVLFIFLVIPVPGEVSYVSETPSSGECRASEDSYPPLLHHIWLNYSAFPSAWKQNIQECLDLNRDYSYRRWSPADIEKLLKTHYSWVLPTYHGYTHNVQRVDAARLFMLYHYGGVYMDMDLGCVTSFNDIIKTKSDYDVILSRGATFGVSNHIMFAKRGNPYLKMAMEALPKRNGWYGLPYVTIMYTAGPGHLTVVLRNYTCKQQVGVFPPEPEHNKYYINFHGGTWHTWDTAIIDTLGMIHKFIKGLISLRMLFVCAFVCTAGYAGWRNVKYCKVLYMLYTV